MAKKSEIVKSLLIAKKHRPKLKLSTGATLLNLGLTDDPLYGLLTGHYYFFVGDSSSGKTWLTMNILAEAAYNPAFKNYRLIHDNVEDGALMDVPRYYGKETARRLECPRLIKGMEVCSETVEDFYYNIDDAIKDGRPFIYLLDSQDSLTSSASNAKFSEQKKARRKGTEVTGTFGDGKAKVHSENIRRVVAALKKSGSILIIISQTRDNLGFGFEKKTRSGGRGLKFYATTEIWTSVRKKHKKEVRGGIKIQTGIDCKIDLKKNRITGDEPSVTIPIMNDIGVDDVGSMIDYLLETDHWELEGKKIAAPEFDFLGSRQKLIQWLKDETEVPMLQHLVGRVWNEIKAEARPTRSSRYAEYDEE
jgi:RecA/RadA recombinase